MGCRGVLMGKDGEEVEGERGREVVSTSQDHDVAGMSLSHSWEGGFDHVDGTEEVGFELFADEGLRSGGDAEFFYCADQGFDVVVSWNGLRCTSSAVLW